MSGKFQICLAAISFILITGSLSAQNNFPKKEKLIINGYTQESYTANDYAGIRAKALGDLYFRMGKHSLAIKYYEQAMKYVPNEADIYFNLGNIYNTEKVYHMAARYFKLAYEKYILPENLNKTQKYFYLSRIRYGMALKQSERSDENDKIAQSIAMEMLAKDVELKENYPDVAVELDKFRRMVYGDVTIYKMPNRQP